MIVFTAFGRLRYVNGSCWLDTVDGGAVPMPMVGGVSRVNLGTTVLELDGQRVRVEVTFVDEDGT